MAEPLDAFLTALKARDLGRMRELVDATPDLARSHVREGTSLLMVTLYYGNEQAAGLLLDRGAPLTIFEAAALGRVDAVAQRLRDEPEALQAHATDGWTPLHLAAHFDRVEAARLLLEQGADLHARSTNGNENTPLHAAAAGRALETARFLLERGADPNATDAGGYTPLHLAAANDHVPLVEAMLAAGADPDIASRDGSTPLQVAQHRGNDAAAEVLHLRARASAG